MRRIVVAPLGRESRTLDHWTGPSFVKLEALMIRRSSMAQPRLVS